MKQDFLQHIFKKQQQKEQVPSNETIAGWTSNVVRTLFPQLSDHYFPDTQAINTEFSKLNEELIRIMHATKACSDCDYIGISNAFFQQLPELYRVLNTDIDAIHSGDPAAHSKFEVIRAYPGFYALCFYRIAHKLIGLDVPVLPRIITEFAHSKTGIDIHPAAQIGEYFMIDHGTGIVIGETTIIGNRVKIYQGVTLGALSINKDMAFQKRHPTIKDDVVIYSGATILGGETVIGEGSVIGGNVWLTQSVPPRSLVQHEPEIKVIEGKYNN